MFHKAAVRFFCFVLLVSLSSSVYGDDNRTAAEKLSLLSSRPVMEVLQAQHLSGEERTTAYIYDDRVEYYDNQLLAQVERTGKLPATNEKGVLFTEAFFTQFRAHNDLYVVQRGWDKNGNCHVRTAKVTVRTNAPLHGVATKSFELEEEGNSCSGDPCSKCKPYDPTFGCRCELGERCNHTVSN